MNSKIPKVVFLVSDTNAGGTATSTSLLIRNINREKFYVIVVTFGSGPIGQKLGAEADEFHNLGVGSFPKLRKVKEGKLRPSPLSYAPLLIWFCRCIWRLFFWLRGNRVGLLHSSVVHYNLIAGIAGRLAGVPSIWHIRGPQQRPWRRGGGVLVEGYLASLIATRFVANSYFTARSFHHSWKDKAIVVWNAINADQLIKNQKKGELRKIAKVADGEKLVGVVGIIAPRKGMSRFIEMAAKLAKSRDDVKFVVVGPPVKGVCEPLLEDLMKMSREFGIADRICFTGELQNSAFYMCDLDVFFMCSRPNTESFGLVVIEAMVAEVPVVAFSNDAMPEIIEDGQTGFLVPEGDTTLAKERILQILDNSELTRSFKEAAKEKVLQDFDVPVLISKIEQIYFDVLQQNNKT